MMPRRIFVVATTATQRRTMMRNTRRWETSTQASPSAMIRDACFSTLSDREPVNDVASTNPHKQQGESPGTDDRGTNRSLETATTATTATAPTTTTASSQRRKSPKHRRSQPRSSERRGDQTAKWKAPFWVPPPSSSSSSSKKQSKTSNKTPKSRQRSTTNRFRDASLPCRKHLDPTNRRKLPTSDWVQIFGALPTTSLEEVLVSIENVLKDEAEKGTIVDLDAYWNPHTDGEPPPLVPSVVEVPVRATPQRLEYSLDQQVVVSMGTDNAASDSLDAFDEKDDGGGTTSTLVQMECFRVIKAHVVLSPFGRPTGWNLQLANPSVVHALLSYAERARVRGNLRIGWKFAKVQEHFPLHLSTKSNKNNKDNNTKDTSSMLVVSDSMVRFENCPHSLTEDYLRHMLSRYELTPKGSTIIKWKGQTNDGRTPPPTFVVRFASPAYARAAVRELQGKMMEGRPMKLIQYPRQLL